MRVVASPATGNGTGTPAPGLPTATTTLRCTTTPSADDEKTIGGRFIAVGFTITTGRGVAFADGGTVVGAGRRPPPLSMLPATTPVTWTAGVPSGGEGGAVTGATDSSPASTCDAAAGGADGAAAAGAGADRTGAGSEKAS